MQKAHSVAGIIAEILRSRGVERIFGLCGGHIMPIWMACDAVGISIVDARDERAAVLMAQAHSELTGELGVALVTAGPGVTNAITGIASAHVARASVLVLSGVPPKGQENCGALQDLAHVEMVKPITRYARTVREPPLVPRELNEAIELALGKPSEPGPVYLDFPTDTLRSGIPQSLLLREHMVGRARPSIMPDAHCVTQAAEMIANVARVLVISGRGCRGAGEELVAFLDVTGASYVDTSESRGLVPESHPAFVHARSCNWRGRSGHYHWPSAGLSACLWFGSDLQARMLYSHFRSFR